MCPREEGRLELATFWARLKSINSSGVEFLMKLRKQDLGKGAIKQKHTQIQETIQQNGDSLFELLFVKET